MERYGLALQNTPGEITHSRGGCNIVIDLVFTAVLLATIEVIPRLGAPACHRPLLGRFLIPRTGEDNA